MSWRTEKAINGVTSDCETDRRQVPEADLMKVRIIVLVVVVTDLGLTKSSIFHDVYFQIEHCNCWWKLQWGEILHAENVQNLWLIFQRHRHGGRHIVSKANSSSDVCGPYSKNNCPISIYNIGHAILAEKASFAGWNYMIGHDNMFHWWNVIQE